MSKYIENFLRGKTELIFARNEPVEKKLEYEYQTPQQFPEDTPSLILESNLDKIEDLMEIYLNKILTEIQK